MCILLEGLREDGQVEGSDLGCKPFIVERMMLEFDLNFNKGCFNA